MQLIIISGKGGTGKTTIASSFAYIQKNSIKGDCDVDAANLHILFQGEDIERKAFIGAKAAKIDPVKCVQCGRCADICRFNAVKNYQIDPLRCEGCGACVLICSAKAISLGDEVTGDTVITQLPEGILSRAEMKIGAEGSGKLVTEVRKNALRKRQEGQWIILDGSPGVGCAVMASITGCDAALIVVEPTQSGLEDFMRVLSVVDYFNVKAFVCINKFDLNERITDQIEAFCNERKIGVLGKIPFDPLVKKTINALQPVICHKDSLMGKEIGAMWERLNYQLKEEIK
ncbi:MinD superfamily P-loop ATPase, contains an inserted ferredoxin domain [Geosporobacter subterraneus DSM 17957]|uniref:MinD superfamily P-loop ATPase, contains an inserted ferredoxin domain n=1 Tax=Geosporobacter subterraneus DSM 17957 TaxID=1121919 RepID=A0A1M6D1D9_9FIRM|nr:ATP-binding protein [Geosporobacter subterraneus]SHI67077.1 MinD superfamily P-loop ATPase, contains an inserted ferredoxin domain [Geosporobacter subterraneus DSM 17957]